jgi:multidrug transporter EmrE-like cation transporter
MPALDSIDRLIRTHDWKWGRFDLLPVSFAIVMATLDVIMMGTAKLVSLDAIPYSIGLAFSTVVYSLQPFLFMKALQFENMTIVNIIWNLASDTLITALGIFYFGETISGLRWVAMFLSIVSIGLFSYTDVTET